MIPSLSAVQAHFFGSMPIEGNALSQLDMVQVLPGFLRLCAFGDLHAGKYGPVGMSALFSNLHPLLIGGDVGCGIMALKLSKTFKKLNADKIVRAWDNLTLPLDEAIEWARDASLSLTDASVLGSIGGGNHFCEITKVMEDWPEYGLSKNDALLLIHSGSRGLGEAALMSLPQVGQGLDPKSDVALSWIARHDHAVKFAHENRLAIGARAASLLGCDWKLLVDCVHNAVERHEEGWLHRKGAADASQSLAVVAGSRDTSSWLVMPNHTLSLESLSSLPHGSGRKFQRSACHGRFRAPKRERDGSILLENGGRLICHDKDLVIEESSGAYKDSTKIMASMMSENLIVKGLELKPVVTFKTGKSS